MTNANTVEMTNTEEVTGEEMADVWEVSTLPPHKKARRGIGADSKFRNLLTGTGTWIGQSSNALRSGRAT